MSVLKTPVHSAPTDTVSPHRTGLTVFHVLVIALSLVMTLSAWEFSRNQMDTRTSARFETERDQIVSLITERMQRYEDALWAGATAIESHGSDISRSEWQAFAKTLRLDTRYPGLNAIAVMHYVEEDGLSAYLNRMSREEPAFSTFPAHGYPSYMPVSYIAPERYSRAALGLDLAFEQERREGAIAARDTGQARISGPIVLVDDTGKKPGFLFYAPFYHGEAPATVEARRESAVGTVFAPFQTSKLMAGLLAQERRGVHFDIIDDGQIIHEEHGTDNAQIDPDPMFSERIALDLYGRTWTLDMRTNLAFREANTFVQPTMILFGGLLIEALIIALLMMMARANARAVAYADRVTMALREESEKLTHANSALESKNEELEQFAYIASHDLKTPIRGIGGLTEMMEDDLEDYFAQPDANPDVAHNLERIRDRLSRMTTLTKGIMEFSRIGRSDESVEPVTLAQVITSLRADLELTDDRLQLEGDVPPITADTFNFRRVLENLVGNAVKYHHDPATLAITVSAREAGGQVTVRVSDNGPGIAPEYHDKIFGMFQTLAPGNHADSTGIGLAIVRKSVENHGGRVSLISNVGEGATFLFTWPVRTETTLSAPLSKAA